MRHEHEQEREYRQRLELAGRIETFAQELNPRSAEYHIAQNLSSKLRDGLFHIDLSQNYTTISEHVAMHRHWEATQYLAPYITEVSKLGLDISTGQAFATANKVDQSHSKTTDHDISLNIST